MVKQYYGLKLQELCEAKEITKMKLSKKQEFLKVVSLVFLVEKVI